MADYETEVYFTGAKFWAAFDAQRAEYPSDDTLLKVLRKGSKQYVQLCAPTGDGGDPINESHPCPGSPGC